MKDTDTIKVGDTVMAWCNESIWEATEVVECLPGVALVRFNDRLVMRRAHHLLRTVEEHAKISLAQ